METIMNDLLTVSNLRKGNILRGIDFAVQEGEMTAIMGPSGSGKSTLLYNVSGMDTPDTGEVYLGGTEITGLSEDEKAELRLKRMGFVFQQMNMLENLNIIDNIALPAVHADRKRRKEYYDRARALMDDFHIGDLAERKVNEVSGGQLQRACICRSIASEVTESFLRINGDGATILMVTHDSRIAAMCERILYILDGEIRGELILGKFEHDDIRAREQKAARWLEGMGW